MLSLNTVKVSESCFMGFTRLIVTSFVTGMAGGFVLLFSVCVFCLLRN